MAGKFAQALGSVVVVDSNHLVEPILRSVCYRHCEGIITQHNHLIMESSRIVHQHRCLCTDGCDHDEGLRADVSTVPHQSDHFVNVSIGHRSYLCSSKSNGDEKMYEYGMMRALGTKQRNLIIMIVVQPV